MADYSQQGNRELIESSITHCSELALAIQAHAQRVTTAEKQIEHVGSAKRIQNIVDELSWLLDCYPDRAVEIPDSIAAPYFERLSKFCEHIAKTTPELIREINLTHLNRCWFQRTEGNADG